MAPKGHFTIPTRIFLTLAQRTKLEQLVEQQGLSLPDLLSELLAGYLDSLPGPMPPVAPVAAPSTESVLHQRRRELQRLRTRMQVADGEPPPWVQNIVAELEQEVARLEREAHG